MSKPTIPFPGTRPIASLPFGEAGRTAFHSIIAEMADGGFNQFRSHEPVIEITASLTAQIARSWNAAKADGNQAALDLAGELFCLLRLAESCLLKADAVKRVFLSIGVEFFKELSEEDIRLQIEALSNQNGGDFPAA